MEERLTWNGRATSAWVRPSCTACTGRCRRARLWVRLGRHAPSTTLKTAAAGRLDVGHDDHVGKAVTNDQAREVDEAAVIGLDGEQVAGGRGENQFVQRRRGAAPMRQLEGFPSRMQLRPIHCRSRAHQPAHQRRPDHHRRSGKVVLTGQRVRANTSSMRSIQSLAHRSGLLSGDQAHCASSRPAGC